VKVADLFARLSLKPDKRSFDQANRMLGFVKKALVGIAAFASVRWLGGLIQDTVALGSAIADMSQRIGVPAEALQQLGFAASQSGSSMEDLGTSLGKLARNMDAAKRGSKEQADAFRAAGVRYKDAAGELRPVEDVFADLADRFATMPDGAEKSALAMRVFGKSGMSMIPLLNEGSAGIAELRKEFVELGGQIDGKTAGELEAFGDEQDKVKVALAGLRNEMVKELLPTLRELTADLLAWVKANRKIIAQKLAFVIKVLIGVLRILAKVVGIVVGALQWFGEHIGVTVALLSSLGAALLIFQRASVMAAMKSAAAWALSLLPFILLAAAIFAVILIVQDLWSWITGGDSVIKDLWQAFKTWIAEGITGLLTGAINGWVDMFQGFSDTVLGIFESIGDAAASVLDTVFGGPNMLDLINLRKEGAALGLRGAELDKYVADNAENETYENAGNRGVGAAPAVRWGAATNFQPPIAGASLGAPGMSGGVNANLTASVVVNAPAGVDATEVARIAGQTVSDALDAQARALSDGTWGDDDE
jgi:hypothetical protein